MRRDGIPRAFRLAGHEITVRVITPAKWRHGKDCIGIWLPHDHRIEVLSTLKDTERQQCFCHEFTHALLDVAGHDKLSRDEAFVDRIGHLLQQALSSFE